MDTSNYDMGIKYEALQEAITQLVASLYAKKYGNFKMDGKSIDSAISTLINYKKNMSPDSYTLNHEALLYIKGVSKRWSS